MSIASFCFVVTVIVTLLITAVAGRRGQRRADLYAAGGKLKGWQNGLAITGDFLSATTVLGITGLYVGSGWDTAIFYLAPLAGLTLMLVLVAGPMRRLGRYTLGDVMTSRLDDGRLRVFIGVNAVGISLAYLLAQMVGAGTLISLLFGLDFTAAVAIVGSLMATYVAVGGMLAATWVQMVKAVLLAGAVVLLSVLALARIGSLGSLYARAGSASGLGHVIVVPGGMHLSLFSSLSLGFGMVLGFVGLPHLLIRFFTVGNARDARRSVSFATTLIALINILLFVVVGPAAVALVTGNPHYADAAGHLKGGVNMATVHLADALGGEWLTGIVAAIAFSTILAVVAGLTIAASSATAHDVVKTLIRPRALTENGEVLVFRLTAVVISLLAMGLALVFQHENVAFLSALAFGIAASTNFPLLMLVLYWPRLTTAGALAGGLVGLVGSVTLIVLSPAVWVKLFHFPAPVFPSDYPALVTAPLAFATAVLVSLWSANSVADNRA